MVFTLSTKFKIIPIASMVLVLMMRSKTGLSEASNSTISACKVTNLLLLYSKNITWKIHFPFVWKIPFDVLQDLGIFLIRQGQFLVVPFSWNIKSPSDSLSSKTHLIFCFGNLILLVLMQPFPVFHFGQSSGPASSTAATAVTLHVFSCCGEFLVCSYFLELLTFSGIVLI